MEQEASPEAPDYLKLCALSQPLAPIPRSGFLLWAQSGRATVHMVPNNLVVGVGKMWGIDNRQG